MSVPVSQVKIGLPIACGRRINYGIHTLGGIGASIDPVLHEQPMVGRRGHSQHPLAHRHKARHMPQNVRPTAASLDTLIVGSGLAGALMALELRRAGHRIAMVTAAHPPSASHAAGGLMNPFTAPRLAPMPDLIARCTAARQYYERLGHELGHSLITPTSVYRLCQSAPERARAQSTRHPWLGPWSETPPIAGFEAPFGGLAIHNAWRLDLPTMLASAVARTDAHRHEFPDPFDWRCIQPRNGCIIWRGRPVGCVLSCEGAGITRNPYWDGLPLQPNGGESLLIQLSADWSTALSAGITLLPLGKRRYWLGATHQPGHSAAGPTDTGRHRLLQGLRDHAAIPLTIDVLAHHAGTRMATPDREPVLGRHPRLPWLAIFNGLGSRGILRAPESVWQLTRHLTRGDPLPAALDVNRYAARLAAS